MWFGSNKTEACKQKLIRNFLKELYKKSPREIRDKKIKKIENKLRRHKKRQIYLQGICIKEENTEKAGLISIYAEKDETKWRLVEQIELPLGEAIATLTTLENKLDEQGYKIFKT